MYYFLYEYIVLQASFKLYIITIIQEQSIFDIDFTLCSLSTIEHWRKCCYQCILQLYNDNDYCYLIDCKKDMPYIIDDRHFDGVIGKA
jgi:hypothetical protein